MNHLVAREKYVGDQSDKNFAEMLASTKALATNFHTLAIEKSMLAEDEKKAGFELNNTSIFVRKDLLLHEQNKFLHEQTENREKHLEFATPATSAYLI